MKPRKVRIVAKGIDPATFDAFVGRYDYGTAVLTVTRKDNRLFAQLAGQQKYGIFPRSATVFFWKVVNAEITFVKNKEGKVVRAIHRQGGRKTRAPKLVNQIVAQVDPAVFKAYVGKYDYGSGKTLTLTLEGDRLFGQLTGQPKLELLPRTEEGFFWRAVNAEITFVRDETGNVVKGIHRQGGRTFDLPKVK